MPLRPHAAVFAPGFASGIGSLPHIDAVESAEISLRLHPHLPATPQLPMRDPREGVVAQWVDALPEVTLAPDGSFVVDRSRVGEPIAAELSSATHTGLLAFLDACDRAPEAPARIKTQLVGPLTLGVALTRAGLPTEIAFARAGEAVRAWARSMEELLALRLPHSAPLIFLDEPALVLWRGSDLPIERERAVDLLSSALAATNCATGVHVCGDGDLRVAFEAGPNVLGVPATDALIADVDVLVRHLDADGWVAWGAVPTDRPIGESADALWRDLASVWCELTRRGCDPLRLRTHGIVTPACGLAGHGPSQAERALRLAADIADRVGDQAVAARLTVGA